MGTIVNLALLAIIVWLAWMMAGGDVILTLIFAPVVWMGLAILAVIVVPEDEGDNMIVGFLMKIFQ
jgi:hypothetical protein